jgi:hypothetical protein
MRQSQVVVLATLVAVIAFTSGRSIADEPKAKAEAKPANKLVGTWKEVSAKYDGKEARPPEGFKSIKHVTPTHFMWVDLDKRRQRDRGVRRAVHPDGGQVRRDVRVRLRRSLQEPQGEDAIFHVQSGGQQVVPQRQDDQRRDPRGGVGAGGESGDEVARRTRRCSGPASRYEMRSMIEKARATAGHVG